MRKVAESIKRLDDSGKLTEQELYGRVEKGTITVEEYNEIKGNSQ